MHDHVILCGLGRVGRRVLEYLRAAGVPVVAIDQTIDPTEEERACPGVTFLRADFRKREVLEQAGLSSAFGVLLLTSDDLVNLSALMTVLHARPGMRAGVRMFNPNLISRLGEVTSHVFALSTSALTAPMLALSARTGGALAAFNLNSTLPMLVSEWTVPEGHAYVGRPLLDLARHFHARIVARQARSGARQLWNELDLAAPLAAGDRLVVCGLGDHVAELTAERDGEALSRFLRGTAVRRQIRMVGRVVAEIDLPVKICATVFFFVITASVLIFHFGMKNDTLVDALYRTISLMATGADMHGEEVEPGSWQKAFISLLRVVGAALTAAFTAILTNYLVRAHLRGALEVRRIPEGGHVVVAGLGNVGFRVVEELVRLGERVVAIERNRDNAFVATARRLGAAVIIGDATVAEVLRQAHVATAKSILATTENELSNLEIALLVREEHPSKRLVVRLIDAQLAQMLREAANIRLALSIPELAAPAFVAALLGDRVRTVLFARDQLLAVVDLVVEEGDPLQGRTVADLAREYRFLPVALTLGDRVELDPPDETRLDVGHDLTAILSFRDLATLFQRDLPR